MIELLPWIFTLIAMIGKLFFVYQNKWAARCWLVSDIYFAVHTYLREDYAVMALMIYYAVTSLWAMRRG